MGFIEIPDSLILRGDEAVEALQYFVNQVEEQRGKKITEKQADALLKIADALIVTIKAETLVKSDKTKKAERFCGLFTFFRKPNSKQR
jgi:hypothetical protein